MQEGAQCVWSWERQEGTCLEPPLPGHCVPSEVCPCLVGTGMVQRERLCSAGFWFLVFGFGFVVVVLSSLGFLIFFSDKE